MAIHIDTYSISCARRTHTTEFYVWHIFPLAYSLEFLRQSFYLRLLIFFHFMFCFVVRAQYPTHKISCFFKIILCSQYIVLQIFFCLFVGVFFCLFVCFPKIHMRLKKGGVFDFKKAYTTYCLNTHFQSLGPFSRREYLFLKMGL